MLPVDGEEQGIPWGVGEVVCGTVGWQRLIGRSIGIGEAAAGSAVTRNCHSSHVFATMAPHDRH
jgi:hypothetical protein